jgi:hypothetical protein
MLRKFLAALGELRVRRRLHIERPGPAVAAFCPVPGQEWLHETVDTFV